MHFWTSKTHPWVEKSPFDKTYLPENYLLDNIEFKVVKCVNIQGDFWPYDPVKESKWLQSIADQHGYPHGIIGSADLSDPEATEKQLQIQIKECRNFRGIRFMLDYHPTDASKRQTSRPDWMTDPTWLKSFALLEKDNLIFDCQVLPCQLIDAAKVAATYPKIQIILNHTGLPYGRTDKDFKEWKDGMTALSEQKNVAVKISGLGMTEPEFTVDSIRPYVTTTLTLFGLDRCMFASNFPVDKKFSDIGKIWNAFEEICDDMGLSEKDKTALFHDNACRFYKV